MLTIGTNTTTATVAICFFGYIFVHLTDVVVSASIMSTFMPAPTLDSIRSIRDIINLDRSMLMVVVALNN